MFLTATHTVTTVEAFVAGAAADGDMSAGITGRRIALHILGSGVHGVHSIVFIHRCGSTL